MDACSGTTDLSTKYQKLATEYSKVSYNKTITYAETKINIVKAFILVMMLYWYLYTSNLMLQFIEIFFPTWGSVYLYIPAKHVTGGYELASVEHPILEDNFFQDSVALIVIAKSWA